MLLNRVEKGLMNNPVRAALQRHVEARRLKELGGVLRSGSRALEVGCGRGVGVPLILDVFGAARVDAFDLDPQMVAQARQRLGREAHRVRLWVGDASRIDAEDETYDAVFDFGIIHHLPDWRAGLGEIRRVLGPGGRFFAEEVLRDFILNPVVRRVLDHPLENRFTHEEFLLALADIGFRVIGEKRFGRSLGWYVADKGAAE
jgi:ubiquinone/menaquinone biosynthesis C-methylase UbiE